MMRFLNFNLVRSEGYSFIINGEILRSLHSLRMTVERSNA